MRFYTFQLARKTLNIAGRDVAVQYLLSVYPEVPKGEQLEPMHKVAHERMIREINNQPQGKGKFMFSARTDRRVAVDWEIVH